MAVQLWFQDRLVWCKLGDYLPWTMDAWSTHTSQHFLDPYALTHILHGIALVWIVGWLFSEFGKNWRFVIAFAAEAIWEIIENTSWIINKYRENTASLDYFGDSIFNSAGDLLTCAVGIWIATRFGWWRSLLLSLAVELLLLVWIRDSLLLNVIMLLYPIEWIKQWQIQ